MLQNDTQIFAFCLVRIFQIIQLVLMQISQIFPHLRCSAKPLFRFVLFVGPARDLFLITKRNALLA